MSAVRELIDALVTAGIDATDAAVLIARAGAEMNSGPSKAALRTRRWREAKASQNVTSDALVEPSQTVTNRHKPSPVTGDPLILSFTSLEREEVKERKKERQLRNVTLPDDWQPTVKHYDAGTKLGFTRQAVLDKAEDMRIWAGSTGAKKVSWDLTFLGFLRRDARQNPSTKPPSKWLSV